MKKCWLYRLLCLVLLGSMLCLAACPGGEPPVVTPPGGDPSTPPAGDENVIYGAGETVKGAGDSIPANSPVLTPVAYDESGAQEVPAANFVRVVFGNFVADKVYRATGKNAIRLAEQENKTYNAKGAVILAENGLRVTDASHLTLKNLVIVGDVSVENSAHVAFENVQIIGNVTVDARSASVSFTDCRLTGETALTLAGDTHTVYRSYIGFTACGITDKATATIVKHCRLAGAGVGISAAARDGIYTYNTLTLTEKDTGVAIGEGSQNLLLGMNVMNGAQRSVSLNGARNTAVVKNSMISASAEGNHAVYLCDNAMGGRLTAKNNTYILADGNTYPADDKPHAAILENNEGDSGDTLLDVDARLPVGADENLLPQVDKDLFVGMERKETVREIDGGRSVYTYMMDCAKEDAVVLVPPGKYSTCREYGNFREEHSNTTVYAYGVYIEAPVGIAKNYGIGHLRIFYLSDFTLKGLTIGYEQQTCGQAYVLEKLDNNRVRVVAGAGMWQEFIDSAEGYFNTVNIGIQREGTFYAIGDFSAYSNAVKKEKDGTMILRLQDEAYEATRKGDILTCRLASGAYTTQVTECENVSFRDMTVYGYSGGFAFYESRNRTGVTYYRVYNTTKSGPLIDEATYEKYLAFETAYGVDLEISQDGQNRYRGSLPHIGSVDATHASNNLQGSQIISCLFENMCDDGTNQNSFPSRLSDVIHNGDGTTMLVYKGHLTYNLYHQTADKSKLQFDRYCIPYKVGDRVYVYTSAGQLVCDTTALSATAEYDTIKSTHPHTDLNGKQITRYSVTVKTDDLHLDALAGYDLTDDSHEATHKVMVDNRSMGSCGFLYDNFMVQNTRSRGVLLKSSDGVVQNCTFRNIAKVAIAIIYEIQWGESSASENLRIERNLIDHTSYSPGESSYKHVAVDIMGPGSGRTEEDYLLYQNIYLIGNQFINRDTSQTPYAVYIQGAKNIYIRDNDFGVVESEECKALWINGAANIELSGNLYPPATDIETYVEGDHYKNVYGDDVGDYIPDKE